LNITKKVIVVYVTVNILSKGELYMHDTHVYCFSEFFNIFDLAF